ncbi:MAG: polysaccharide biosynthesis protein [Candidatus Peregrinibacteria bacterium]|nr:polysaccharide biosynthesis protein [Candidatus Peregrinibacteria bacterium]
MYNNKVIFVSGGTGSWGHELVKQLLEKYQPKEIRIYSRGEHRQVEMKHEFNNHPALRFIIGDVRDKNILDLSMKGVDYVFHLAALKHVPVCEENCWEAVLTNVYGTQNIIECAIANNVKKVVDISTDKAVDPFNLYGVTKACGEKLIINANQNYITDTKFVCIRGGNVMGTNGSVLPLFRKQISEKNEITITDPKMTRYLMSIREAISLIFQAVISAQGGEVFVMRMPATTLENIANVMTKMYGDENTTRRHIGVRPGEKLHEVLVSKNEAPRTKIYSDTYYVILPQYPCAEIDETYGKYDPIDSEEFTSQNARRMDDKEFIETLERENLCQGLPQNTPDHRPLHVDVSDQKEAQPLPQL